MLKEWFGNNIAKELPWIELIPEQSNNKEREMIFENYLSSFSLTKFHKLILFVLFNRIESDGWDRIFPLPDAAGA